ncbi:MAG TPA: bifunctional nuclease family protein [Fimbriimonadaceae bacterium]|nr:hypothetical protein [Armatimonadota bacterium]HCM74206.1 hypothetical protein [Armatimonadota bacterium]HRD30292.1 bifunctional nuclease family protein [Fimbriimonadaceae bacterium]HRE94022.1 bifunctional nuclease family protein [Fimbriimonadaceae bacterium]HRI73468.1 bifunctional nuclease family protein [Fimbriimonadaceae bacterium]
MADERFDEPDDQNEGQEEVPSAFFPYLSGQEEALGEDFNREPVAVQVENVFAAKTSENVQRFVMLSDGVRKLPILIGPFEAAAISFALNDEQPDRPLTHDLLRNMVERLGGEVTQVLIDDMWSGTFYAKVFVRHQREDVMFDARPSDAIALAVRTGAPVFVAEGILEHHGR